jgi:hypothetical protein
MLTGIMLLPGSFSGRISSPSPQRGPLILLEILRVCPKILEKLCYKNILFWNTDLPSKRMSFAIFIRDADIVFTAPLLSTKASCAAYLRKKKK